MGAKDTYRVGRASEIYQRFSIAASATSELAFLRKIMSQMSREKGSTRRYFSRMRWSRPVLVGGISALGLFIAELSQWIFNRRALHGGIYFQSTPSAEMMQTLDLSVLASRPLHSLFYLHYQPPGFDLLRLFLAAPEFLTGLTISDRQVDIRLYMLHAVFYGLINATVFYWTSTLAKSQVVAVITTIAWALYPGNLAMATYLDSMYTSTSLLAIATHHYLQYLRQSRLRNIVFAGLSLLVLSMTRTSLQPIVLLLVVLTTLPLVHSRHDGIRKSSLNIGYVIFALCVLLLPIKQWFVFGTVSSTTSSGHHLLGMVRHNPSPEELMTVEIPTRIRQNSTVFENKYNTAEEVVLNYQYTRVFARICKSDPSGCLREALTSAKRSLIKGAGATQNYQPNTLSDGLPWTNLSASLFSGTSYLVLVAAGSLALAVRERSQICRLRGRGLRQVLPLLVLYGLIAFTLLFGSLRFTEVTEMGAPFGWYDGFTWTESNRLKFLFEIISFPIGVSGVCVGMLFMVKAASAKIQTRLR